MAVKFFLLALPLESGVPSSTGDDAANPPSITPSNPSLKALCDKNVKEYNEGNCPSTASDVALITGIIDKRGVGIMSLGQSLQAVVLFLSLTTLFVLLGPGVSILTEWPAQ